MAYSSDEIITYLNKTYPQQMSLELKSIADYSISVSKSVLHQCIIGIAAGDFGGSSGISHYEHRMKNELKDVSPHIHCLPWFFGNDEMDELKKNVHRTGRLLQSPG